MALDTPMRRASALAVGLVAALVLPFPDGAIDGADREHVTFTYAGILAASTVGGSVSLDSQTMEHELAGVGAGWTDVTEDLTDAPIVCDYGINSSRPDVRVAKTGSLSYGLRNDDQNSGAVLGWYSPYNVLRRTGFDFGIRVRHTLIYRGEPFRWMGRLRVIDAIPGTYGDRVTNCTAFDWMDEAARAVVQAALQQNQRSDQVFSALISNAATAPDQTSIDVGSDSYIFALDNVPTNSKVLGALGNLALSEVGYIGQRRDAVNGQTVFFESRRTRPTYSALMITLADSQFETLDISGQGGDIINHVRTTVHPRRTDSGATTIIATLDTSTLEALSPGESQTLFIEYTDPVQRDTKIGAMNQVTPVRGTDFTFNSARDRSGSDLSAKFSVTVTFFSSALKLTVSNDGGISGSAAVVPGYFTLFQARGDGVYALNGVTSERKNQPSIDQYGDNVIELDLIHQSSTSFGQNVSDYLATLFATPTANVRAIRFLANQSDALMRAALVGDISTRIALSEAVSGVTTAAEYFINAVKLEVMDQNLVYCTWLLTPADRTAYWQLGITGASELGVSTVLGF